MLQGPDIVLRLKRKLDAPLPTASILLVPQKKIKTEEKSASEKPEFLPNFSNLSFKDEVNGKLWKRMSILQEDELSEKLKGMGAPVPEISLLHRLRLRKPDPKELKSPKKRVVSAQARQKLLEKYRNTAIPKTETKEKEYTEQEILSNYMPLVKEFLAEEKRLEFNRALKEKQEMDSIELEPLEIEVFKPSNDNDEDATIVRYEPFHQDLRYEYEYDIEREYESDDSNKSIDYSDESSDEEDPLSEENAHQAVDATEDTIVYQEDNEEIDDYDDDDDFRYNDDSKPIYEEPDSFILSKNGKTPVKSLWF